jgi:hypothetical protein
MAVQMAALSLYRTAFRESAIQLLVPHSVAVAEMELFLNREH